MVNLVAAKGATHVSSRGDEVICLIWRGVPQHRLRGFGAPMLSHSLLDSRSRVPTDERLSGIALGDLNATMHQVDPKTGRVADNFYILC
jgi:hypothetical protein